MATAFEKRYGPKGTVLYPSRSATVGEYDAPCKSSRRSGDPVFAFAGTIHTRGYARSLATLAEVLAGHKAKLILHSNLPISAARESGLDRANVIVKPVVPAAELLPQLRDEADVLFVPMSFAVEDIPNMRVSFPSKLADYTAAGLPLLIWGPASCSAVRWAKENPGVAEVIDDPASPALAAAAAKLINGPQYRDNLAANALEKGRQFFSHSAALGTLYSAILGE
jgi:hypothetical protein